MRTLFQEKSRGRGGDARRGSETGAGGVRRTLRAVPALLRIGLAETVAYRAEFLVWVLTTTLPLIMLGLWTSVASEGPFRQLHVQPTSSPTTWARWSSAT